MVADKTSVDKRFETWLFRGYYNVYGQHRESSCPGETSCKGPRWQNYIGGGLSPGGKCPDGGGGRGDSEGGTSCGRQTSWGAKALGGQISQGNYHIKT